MIGVIVTPGALPGGNTLVQPQQEQGVASGKAGD
jgi:hypothetical protein